MTYNELITRLGLDDDEVLTVYPYGSRLYGTDRPDSDWDYIIITKSTTRDTLGIDDQIHATLYAQDYYLERLVTHEISLLECMSLRPEQCLKCVLHPQLDSIDRGLLRESISTKCSNSWIKGKKKLTIYDDEKNHLIGMKSLFHSIRMAGFGRQEAIHGKIIDFTCYKALYTGMYAAERTWDNLKMAYGPIAAEELTEFRKVAPKNAKDE